MALTKVGKEGVTGISNSSNATAITIDSSENVGIGVTDPSTWSLGTALHIGNKENNLWGEADYAIHMSQNAYYNSGWKYSHTDEATRYSQEDGKHIWSYAGSGSANAALTWSEAMRIDTSGHVGIGTTTLTGSGTPDETDNATGIRLLSLGFLGIGRDAGICGQFNRNNEGAILGFRRAGGEVGTISVSSSSTAYNTSSDYRLKENVTYDWDATTRLKQLKPARFNFIADADTTVDGFLAHEAQTVVPEAVTGTHNEVDADGNPIMQGIDQSKIVPLLVKTILELEARITALETA